MTLFRAQIRTSIGAVQFLGPVPFDRSVTVSIDTAVVGFVCIAENEVSALAEGTILRGEDTKFSLLSDTPLWVFTDGGAPSDPVVSVMATGYDVEEKLATACR